ncbi:hypothetical protein GSF22_15280 [Micromonospora echinofusca]|uniref:CoA carboxyltransferase N-terminal domain-containing protein n=2 Tax=Micromonospora echinofusca TaxID=47858 RepID=A0ABS3VS54_MICEH|nr:hypothetical protein [Micromonospora echinofusca]
MHEPDDSGVMAVRGQVAGQPVVAYCTDAPVTEGALGDRGCRHIVHAIDVAVRDRVPVIGVWRSAAARTGDPVESTDGVERLFSAMMRASGLVPHIVVDTEEAYPQTCLGPLLAELVAQQHQIPGGAAAPAGRGHHGAIPL